MLLSIEQTIEALGISRPSVYALIRSGKLPAVRLGSRTFIRQKDLEQFVDGLPEIELPAKTERMTK